jgi:CO/xanthine dehydrogenase FAD-binding subunit
MNVVTPSSLFDALRAKDAHPDARALAGGTDLFAQWQAGAARPETVIALERVHDLREITADRDGLRIGAAVSHARLIREHEVSHGYPALAAAAQTVGAPAIRAMGTIGGNIANASPAADLPPVLLAYDAQVVLVSLRGERSVPIAQFFTGYRRVDLAADELIAAVWLPRPADATHAAYLKVGTRAAQSIAKVALGAAVVLDASRAVVHVRMAAASVAATPVRLPEVEAAIAGCRLDAATIARAADVARTTVQPIDDVRSTAAYRARILGNLVERFLGSVA